MRKTKVTIQAREGIETSRVLLVSPTALRNNSSPWGHWNYCGVRYLWSALPVTIQAREGIETPTCQLVLVRDKSVTIQAREGIETRLF